MGKMHAEVLLKEEKEQIERKWGISESNGDGLVL